MHYKARKELTIVELNDNEENFSFDKLTEIILRKPSDIIYCERNGKLYGIVSMGDIARANEAGADCVTINTRFTCILYGEHMRARKIFGDKVNIHELPVVNEDNVLLGTYSRWDDLLINQYIARMFKRRGKKNRVSGTVNIAFVRPCEVFEEKQKVFLECLQYFKLKGVKAEVIGYEEISDYIEYAEWILFVDEEEWRAIDTLWILRNDFNRRKFATWKKYIEYENMEVDLNRIQKEGVHIFNLCFQDSDYSWMLKKDISAKYAALQTKISNKLLPAMHENFFADLYTEGYVHSITHLRFSVESKSGCGRLKDTNTQFYRVVNGERYTVGQPEKYKKTVYFVGACFVYGHYVEDKNTIESILQRRINDGEYDIKVVNCGSPSYTGSFYVDLMQARLSEIPLKKGDIVIVYVGDKYFHGITEIDLMSILERHAVNADWMIDKPQHCNHKLNELYAEAVYNKLESVFDETLNGQGEMIDNNIDFIKDIYIDRYFKDTDFFKYEKVGSIVMNCNPFTNGHRYLIEQALQKVDFLIIFVVEEDKSVFSFAERFAMAYEGVADLDNVMVVPSGPFILARTTFPEYFIKAKDEDLVENVENDISLFAERIAPYLNIKCRFVGEEPEDGVTNEYNLAMKRLLPRSGIELIEIPRKEQNGKYISASSVREYLEDNDLEKVKELVPESTIRLLFNLCGETEELYNIE